MDTYVRLPLRTERGRRIFYNQKIIMPNKEKLKRLLQDDIYMHSKSFLESKMVIGDSQTIEQKVKSDSSFSYDKKQDLINEYNSYAYILNNPNINRDTLRQLYNIRSEGILDSYSMNHFGKYYRKGKVFIVKKRFDFIEAMDYKKVEDYMERLIEYINIDEEDSEIDEFIKSQIIHFYLYYVHPYFDLNKRTSRMLSTWHLVRKEAYPYIVFEKALLFDLTSYYKFLFEARKGNMTNLLNHIIGQTEIQLERESVIHSIEKNINLSKEEKLIIELISIKQIVTLEDIFKQLQRLNIHIIKSQFIEKYIYPLIEKDILLTVGKTQKSLTKKIPNYVLMLNRELIDIDMPHKLLKRK